MTIQDEDMIGRSMTGLTFEYAPVAGIVVSDVCYLDGEPYVRVRTDDGTEVSMLLYYALDVPDDDSDSGLSIQSTINEDVIK